MTPNTRMSCAASFGAGPAPQGPGQQPRLPDPMLTPIPPSAEEHSVVRLAHHVPLLIGSALLRPRQFKIPSDRRPSVHWGASLIGSQPTRTLCPNLMRRPPDRNSATHSGWSPRDSFPRCPALSESARLPLSTRPAVPLYPYQNQPRNPLAGRLRYSSVTCPGLATLPVHSTVLRRWVTPSGWIPQPSYQTLAVPLPPPSSVNTRMSCAASIGAGLAPQGP